MNYDISTYTNEDLLDLLELPEEYSSQDIDERCNQNIEKYKTSHPELSKLFLQIKERLMNSSSESESEDTDNNSDNDIENSMHTPNIQHAQATSINQTSLVGRYPLYEKYAFYANNPHQFKTDIQQINSTDIVPGTMNPFFRKSYKKIIVIDSKYRENYFETNSNDFHISFPESVKNVINMTVTNVDIINAHYPISATEGTNYMKITLIPRNSSDASYVIPIQLESGNMTSTEITEQINEQLRIFFANKNKHISVLFPDDTETDPFPKEQIIKCQISKYSGRTIFTVHSDISGSTQDNQFKEMQLDFTNPINEDLPPFFSLGWILGFRNRYYTGARTYKSESIFNQSGRQAVYLAIDDYQNHRNERICLLHQDAFFYKNLISRVPLRDNKFSITFNDMSERIEPSRYYYGPVDLQRFHVQLFDEYGLLFDNNNMDFNFVIEVEIMYQL